MGKHECISIVMENIIPQVVAYMNMPAELANDREAARNFFHYILQPITSIHLHSDLRSELGANSDISYVYIFSYSYTRLALLPDLFHVE